MVYFGNCYEFTIQIVRKPLLDNQISSAPPFFAFRTNLIEPHEGVYLSIRKFKQTTTRWGVYPLNSPHRGHITIIVLLNALLYFVSERLLI